MFSKTAAFLSVPLKCYLEKRMTATALSMNINFGKVSQLPCLDSTQVTTVSGGFLWAKAHFSSTFPLLSNILFALGLL